MTATSFVSWLFPDSTRTTYTRDLHARPGEKHNAKMWRFWLSFPVKLTISFVLQNSFIQLESNFHRDNMVRRKCKHCPIPGCGSKFLVRLADHLTRVHELPGIERKYWLQFAKLQNTDVVRVYEKEAGPKTIFSINQRAQRGKTQR